MNNFPLDTISEPEVLISNDIKKLSDRSQLWYSEWILSLTKGKTFFGLNWNWPNVFDSDPGGFYDTYVFSWHVEAWPHDWLKNFCETHADSQIIVIGEYAKPKKYFDLPNLKCLVYHCWGHLLQEVLNYNQSQFVDFKKRKHVLSSLVNKPSYFKALTTAHLLMKHRDKDLIFSWNINKRGEICPSLNFLDPEHLPSENLRPLFDFYHSELKHQTFALDDFNDTRFSNYFSNIPAYTDCLINITNETYSQSYHNGTVLPGPFLTDKTWKPLLSGCALLSQGPRGVYSYLQKFGFVFDYSWDIGYDQRHGDIDRFNYFLKTLDNVLQMPHDYLAQTLEKATKYNYEHIRSKEFFLQVKKINQENLEEFLQSY